MESTALTEVRRLGPLVLGTTLFTVMSAAASPPDPAGWNQVRALELQDGALTVSTHSGTKSMELATGRWSYHSATRSVTGRMAPTVDSLAITLSDLASRGLAGELLAATSSSSTGWILARGYDGGLVISGGGRNRWYELADMEPAKVTGFEGADGHFWIGTDDGVIEVNLQRMRSWITRTIRPMGSVIMTATLDGAAYAVDAVHGLFRIREDGSVEHLGPDSVGSMGGYPAAVTVDRMICIADASAVTSDQTDPVIMQVYDPATGWGKPRRAPRPGRVRMLADGDGVLVWAGHDLGDPSDGSWLAGWFGRFDPKRRAWVLYSSHAVDAVRVNPVRAREHVPLAAGVSETRERIIWIQPGRGTAIPASRKQMAEWADNWPARWQSTGFPMPEWSPSPPPWAAGFTRSGAPITPFAELPVPGSLREVVIARP